jgi:6-phosphogluconolactonase (cycloisomerase 2 family)
MKHKLLNRRKFVQLMGYSSALGAVGLQSHWLSASPLQAGRSAFAYLGFAGDQSSQSKQGIQVFAVDGERWTPTQTIAAKNPSFLALHPNQRFLYAVNEIDSYQGLPMGTVEAYGIHPHSGNLSLLNRQPLSLSGVLPKHLAISPDGRSLVVAVHGGGAYNLLPIREDGHLERVSGIVKETGSGPNVEHQDSAHPQMVIFDRTGQHLLSADLGNDTLNVLSLNDDGLAITGRSNTEPGSGPRQMVLHPSGRLVYVMNELDASISCFGYDAANGTLQERLHHAAIGANVSRRGTAAMAMHPSGDLLYTSYSGSGASDIMVWRINPASGALKPVQLSTNQMASVPVTSMVASNDSLLVLSHQAEGVLHLPVDAASGRLSRPVQVARVKTPISLAVKYI